MEIEINFDENKITINLINSMKFKLVFYMYQSCNDKGINYYKNLLMCMNKILQIYSYIRKNLESKINK